MPKTDIATESVRHIIHIWICKEKKEATLDRLLRAAGKMDLLGGLISPIKLEMQGQRNKKEDCSVSSSYLLV